MKNDDLVVVNLEDCVEPQPYIGRVCKIEDGQVTVHWFQGRYNKAWVAIYTGVGRNRTPMIQTIPVESILLFGFKLTGKKHLYHATAERIKRIYENL